MTAGIGSDAFRAAMARLGAAVSIVVTDGAAGRHGMTASAVCSVSDSPASLLLCINRSSRMYGLARQNGVLSVNVLAGGQEALSATFSDKDRDTAARFASGEWAMFGNGVPVLRGALAAFGCSIASVTDIGSHGVFLCDVGYLSVGGAEPALVYFDRCYHRLPMRVAAA